MARIVGKWGIIWALLMTLGAVGCVKDKPAEDVDMGTNNDGGTNNDLGFTAAAGTWNPRFAPEEDDFYRVPWPSDARLKDGSPDLSDFPNANNALIARYIETIGAIRGYSNMPVIYVNFQGELGEVVLPEPAETILENSSVKLMDVSEEGCGDLVPVEAILDREGDSYIEPNTLKIAPIPGWPLKAGGTYAFILTRDFGGKDETARPLEFALAYKGAPEAAQAIAESLQPLRTCWEETLDLSPESLAVATVFTVQDPLAEMKMLRALVWSDDTPLKPITDLLEWEERSTADYTVYRANIEFPIFQEGIAPYDTLGGLVLDDAGVPEIQRWELVPIALTIPVGWAGPQKLLIWQGGTGASLRSHIGDNHIEAALRNGFAIATFVPQFHDNRGTGPFDTELDTFNFVNPEAGRTVFRQQAAEISYFIRVLEQRLEELPVLRFIDTTNIYYGGHSQGALVGAMVAAVEPRIDTYMMSGVGCYLSDTIITRKEPFDILSLAEGLIRSSQLDRFHPGIHLTQIAADAVDCMNYGTHWRGWEEHPQGSSVFLVNGAHDATTSTTAMNALLVVSGVPSVGKAGWETDPYALMAPGESASPIVGNREAWDGSALTMGAYLSADDDHFTLYDHVFVAEAAALFWETASMGEARIELNP